jgi:hypothetical protein
MRVILPDILIVSIFLLSGCARGNVELLEARLRSREDAVHRLNSELAQAQQELARSQRERDILQQQLVATQRDQVQLEVSRTLARIEGLNIDSKLTGILENREGPHSRELNLLLSPVDSNEDPVKLEGRTVVELFDFSSPAPHRKLHVWEFTPQETAAKWHSGFIGEGFQFTLPIPPSTEPESLTINVSFETPDGRRFHDTHEVAGSARSRTPQPGTNEPPPLPLSDRTVRAESREFIPTDYTRELEALPPVSAKNIPLEQLFAPE